MYTSVCYICNKQVYNVTKSETRVKYIEVTGQKLNPDNNLCPICCHLVHKFSMFKMLCLKQSYDLNTFHNQTILAFQTTNIELLTICPDSNCHENEDNILSTRQEYMSDVYDEEADSNINIDSYNELTDTVDTNSVVDLSITKSVNTKDVSNTEGNNMQAESEMGTKSPEGVKVKKKKKKSFKKLILSYEEQKAVLESQRRERKYVDSVYKCHSCALGFLFEDTYLSHMVRHEESNGQHHCDVCGLRFASQNLRYMHTILHAERYQCCKCGSVLKRPHKKRHMNECWHGCRDAASCQLCTKVFKDPNGLQQHMKRYHGTEPSKSHSCNTCGQTHANQRALRTHMMKHVDHRFKCDQCESTYSSPYVLKRHKRSHAAEARAYCDACGKWYRSEQVLREHLAVNANHRQYSFECPVCRKACATRRSLASHAETMHNQVERYTCDLCGNKYRSRRSLSDHVRRHSKLAKPALCPLCGNQYSNKSKLRRHMKEVCERNVQEPVYTS